MVRNKLTIERKRFDIFMTRYHCRAYGAQRLGQAFYNEFELHKVVDQDQFANLYERSGDDALSYIKSIFIFN